MDLCPHSGQVSSESAMISVTSFLAMTYKSASLEYLFYRCLVKTLDTGKNYLVTVGHVIQGYRKNFRVGATVIGHLQKAHGTAAHY